MHYINFLCPQSKARGYSLSFCLFYSRKLCATGCFWSRSSQSWLWFSLSQRSNLDPRSSSSSCNSKYRSGNASSLWEGGALARAICEPAFTSQAWSPGFALLNCKQRSHCREDVNWDFPQAWKLDQKLLDHIAFSFCPSPGASLIFCFLGLSYAPFVASTVLGENRLCFYQHADRVHCVYFMSECCQFLILWSSQEHCAILTIKVDFPGIWLLASCQGLTWAPRKRFSYPVQEVRRELFP